MVKKIKFNILVDGKSVGDFEQLQDNFSANLLDYIENQKLAKWFSVRDMDDKSKQVSAIDPNASQMEQMKALCQILELEEDEDVITYLIEARDARNKERSEKLSNISSAGNPESVPEQDEVEEVDSKPKGEDWSGRDFKDRDFTGADLRGYNLSGTDFSGANLTDANLSDCDLSKAVFTGAKLIGTNFSYSNLREAVLTEIRCFWENWQYSEFYRDEEREGKAANSGGKGPNFTHATLDKAVLTGYFINADFTHVHAHEINTSSYKSGHGDIGASFVGAKMLDADFSFSIFSEKTYLNKFQVKQGKFLGVKFECSLWDELSW